MKCQTRSRGFWLWIAAAVAVAVIAVPAASAGIPKYDTSSTITQEQGMVEGRVTSEVRKCMAGRQVVPFKEVFGDYRLNDRKVGTARSERDGRWGQRSLP